MIKKVEIGEISAEKFWQSYNAWKNHVLKGNCIKLCRSMDMIVEEEMSVLYVRK